MHVGRRKEKAPYAPVFAKSDKSDPWSRINDPGNRMASVTC